MPFFQKSQTGADYCGHAGKHHWPPVPFGCKAVPDSVVAGPEGGLVSSCDWQCDPVGHGAGVGSLVDGTGSLHGCLHDPPP